MQWAYRQVGVGVGVSVSMADARPGDLQFFDDPVTHVGFSVGDDKFLEAPQSGDVVKVSDVRSSLTGVRRIVL